MSAKIFIEGGAPADDRRNREAFRKLFEKAGFRRPRSPQPVMCGPRSAVRRDFETEHRQADPNDYVAMLLDSEEPLADLERTWQHLATRKGDEWKCPHGAEDDQVLFMTTCMETWIVADRVALSAHYGHKLQHSALPPLSKLEERHRHDLHDALTHATRSCSNAYRKGRRSFEVVAKLNPATLRQHLPSFERLLRILDERL